MRATAAVLAGLLLGATGCLAPFSWPEDRRTLAGPPPEDALTLVAECLERGDERAAVPHLRSYLRTHPEAAMMRLHLAELHLKHGEFPEARVHFERFVEDADPSNGPARDRLPQVHTRLMELAGAEDDSFREHLHRGAGLLCLVRKWDADPSRRDEAAAERTLARALAALRAAKQERPADATVNLRLAEVYERLGQPGAARECLRAARAALPDPSLGPRDRERLEEAAAVR